MDGYKKDDYGTFLSEFGSLFAQFFRCKIAGSVKTSYGYVTFGFSNSADSTFDWKDLGTHLGNPQELDLVMPLQTGTWIFDAPTAAGQNTGKDEGKTSNPRLFSAETEKTASENKKKHSFLQQAKKILKLKSLNPHVFDHIWYIDTLSLFNIFSQSYCETVTFFFGFVDRLTVSPKSEKSLLSFQWRFQDLEQGEKIEVNPWETWWRP